LTSLNLAYICIGIATVSVIPKLESIVVECHTVPIAWPLVWLGGLPVGVVPGRVIRPNKYALHVKKLKI
jgi:hypothetical protein